ncbi:LLM class flavin-dependent oxidoreductase [Amycolatopsis sp. WQ 127309]|uniref:LLM class flavin-dependent oxidoreductase n=1 Tax=Amycolatopsis sp. WQ 127309 TaxID=2932773 RepID=UPI001FF521BC|nr:LLM class flavin-dependent oxidoreductase [Amycolatopsis sp. WQ 127309]UOZ03435.1 LLM class flavin-dependent oxidoreductase [Amycolatopsis sp. WQ 127309]
MRFSIYLNPQTRGREEDVPIIETTIGQALQATRAGVEGLLLTEHHFSGYNTYGNNFMLGCHLAALTPPGTMYFMGVAVPPLHQPLRLAQSCTLLDILTRGNCVIGFGPGGSAVEYTGLGRDPGTRREEMMENLDVLEAALAKQDDGSVYDWKTRHDKGSLRTRIMPSPYSPDGVKFARATSTDTSAAWAGSKGWFLMTARDLSPAVGTRLKVYTDALVEAGYDDAYVQHRLDWSLCQKQIIIRDTDREAERFARHLMVEMGERQKRNFNQNTHDPEAAQYMKTVVSVSPQNPDEFLKYAMFVGTADTVAEQIAEYEAAGLRHLSVLSNFGYQTAEESGETMDRFLDEVLPRFRKPAGDPS